MATFIYPVVHQQKLTCLDIYRNEYMNHEEHEEKNDEFPNNPFESFVPFVVKKIICVYRARHASKARRAGLL